MNKNLFLCLVCTVENTWNSRYQITVNLAIPCIITQERQLNTDKLHIITAGITA